MTLVAQGLRVIPIYKSCQTERQCWFLQGTSKVVIVNDVIAIMRVCGCYSRYNKNIKWLHD